MNCLICRETDLIDGLTSIAFERDEFRLLIRDVPAWVCPNCGEAVLEEEVTAELIRQAEGQFAEGVREAVCGYQSAAATDASILASSEWAWEAFKSSLVER